MAADGEADSEQYSLSREGFFLRGKKNIISHNKKADFYMHFGRIVIDLIAQKIK